MLSNSRHAIYDFLRDFPRLVAGPALLPLLLSPAPCDAQQRVGQVNGTVQGSIGAVVQGANLIVSTAEINETDCTLETNKSEIYIASLLQVRTYLITLEATNVRSSELVGIVLNVGDTLSNDVDLKVSTPTRSP